MSRMLQEIPERFQCLQFASGNSAQHTRDMANVDESKIVRQKPGLDPADLNFLQRPIFRWINIVLYRRRAEWRKADIPHLLRIGVSSIAASRRMARLLDATGKESTGRGVISAPKDFPTAIVDTWKLGKALWDPATPAHVRRERYKQTRWFPDFVEAAYCPPAGTGIAGGPGRRDIRSAEPPWPGQLASAPLRSRSPARVRAHLTRSTRVIGARRIRKFERRHKGRRQLIKKIISDARFVVVARGTPQHAKNPITMRLYYAAMRCVSS
jgi:hypothetical protein